MKYFVVRKFKRECREGILVEADSAEMARFLANQERDYNWDVFESEKYINYDSYQIIRLEE